jgi:DNA-binding Xre family transcriptional regulator
MAKMVINLKELMQRKTISEGRDPRYNPITHLELSQRTGIPQTTISRWVGNRVDRVDLSILETLCRYFECGVEEILVFKSDT